MKPKLNTKKSFSYKPKWKIKNSSVSKIFCKYHFYTLSNMEMWQCLSLHFKVLLIWFIFTELATLEKEITTRAKKKKMNRKTETVMINVTAWILCMTELYLWFWLWFKQCDICLYFILYNTFTYNSYYFR